MFACCSVFFLFIISVESRERAALTRASGGFGPPQQKGRLGVKSRRDSQSGSEPESRRIPGA